MKVQIFYFSGTGNSLYIAKKLATGLPEAELVPMVHALKEGQFEIRAEAVGFVFPIHAFTMPWIVKDFLKKLKPQSASYLFAVATRGGSPCRVFKEMDAILQKSGKQLAAQFFVDMPNNYLPIYEMPKQAEIDKLNEDAEARIKQITEIVQLRRESKEKDPHGSFMEENVLFPVLTKVFHGTGYFNLQNSFYADPHCTSCGLCSRICPAGRIEPGEKPRWNKEPACTYCLACVHYCPAKAIQIKKSKSAERGRYRHQDIAATEIMQQK